MPNSISLQELEALNFIRAGSIPLDGRRCQSQMAQVGPCVTRPRLAQEFSSAMTGIPYQAMA